MVRMVVSLGRVGQLQERVGGRARLGEEGAHRLEVLAECSDTTGQTSESFWTLARALKSLTARYNSLKMIQINNKNISQQER